LTAITSDTGMHHWRWILLEEGRKRLVDLSIDRFGIDRYQKLRGKTQELRLGNFRQGCLNNDIQKKGVIALKLSALRVDHVKVADVTTFLAFTREKQLNTDLANLSRFKCRKCDGCTRFGQFDEAVLLLYTGLCHSSNK
jgi:hypothetical protein